LGGGDAVAFMRGSKGGVAISDPKEMASAASNPGEVMAKLIANISHASRERMSAVNQLNRRQAHE
jgi:hypothetical protein